MTNEYYILLYHGVTSTTSYGIENFSGKHIQSDEFDKQMRFIHKKMNPITLREACENQDLPPKSVVVTFDDTFKNMRSVALPILKKYQIPATFFITTGLVGTDTISWVDRLEHIINYAQKEEFVIRNPHRRSFSIRNNEEKIKTIREIKHIIKQSKTKVHDLILETIQDQIGIVPIEGIKNYENLSVDDVRELFDPPTYEIGGHTVNHEILSQLKQNDLEHEVVSCIDTLGRLVDSRVDLFSYPEGQAEHFNNTVIRFMKSANIKICPSAIPGVNTPGDSPFNLKRIMVGFMGAKFPFEEVSDEIIVRNFS